MIDHPVTCASVQPDGKDGDCNCGGGARVAARAEAAEAMRTPEALQLAVDAALEGNTLLNGRDPEEEGIIDREECADCEASTAGPGTHVCAPAPTCDCGRPLAPGKAVCSECDAESATEAEFAALMGYDTEPAEDETAETVVEATLTDDQIREIQAMGAMKAEAA